MLEVVEMWRLRNAKGKKRIMRGEDSGGSIWGMQETPVIRWGRGKGKRRKAHTLKMCHFSVVSRSQQQSTRSWNILSEVGQLQSQTSELLHLLNGLSDRGFSSEALRSGCCRNSGARNSWEGCKPDFCSVSTLATLSPREFCATFQLTFVWAHTFPASSTA